MRAAIRHRVGLEASAQQVAAGFANRPAEDDVATERDHVPGMNLLRPGRHLFGMRFHKRADAVLIRLDAGAHARADLIVTLTTDGLVPPESLNHVLAVILRPEDFGHRAVGAAVNFWPFFQTGFRPPVAR